MPKGDTARVEFFKKAFQENIQPFWKLEYFFLGGGFFREEKSASVFMYVIKILLLENKQTV